MGIFSPVELPGPGIFQVIVQATGNALTKAVTAAEARFEMVESLMEVW